MRMNILMITLVIILGAPALAQTHQHGTASTGDGQFNPFVTIDRRGGFYLVYVQRTGGASDVMLKHSIDGVTFSPPVRVNDAPGDATVRNENPPKIAIGSNGEVYICWANERGRWKGNIRLARSTDGGRTFSPAITLNSDGDGEPVGHAFQSLAVDHRGRIYVAWIDERKKGKEDRGAEIWLSVSADGGKTFSPDRSILSDVCECCRTNLQISAEGEIYLTYRTVPRTGAMYRDVILAKSSDGGKTFAQTTVSRDGWEINGCPVAGPGLNVDEAGHLTVVWFMGGGAKPGLYYAYSADKGRTFSARQWLDAQQKMGKHATIANVADGKIFVGWDDAGEKTFSLWGVLDPNKGLLRRSGEHEGIAYPVVAANGKVAVIAAMKMAAREIIIYSEKL
jgi:hypothetical protein